MNHTSLVVAALLAAIPAAAAPVATITATDQNAVTRQVAVTFDLSEAAIVTLGAQVSMDGGSSWIDIDTNVVHVTGDVNRKIAAGNGHTAIWNADRDWPGHPASGETIRAVVRCWTDSNPPLYLVMSCVDTSKRWYFTDERQIPGGITNRLYKTEYLAMRRIYAKNIAWPMSSPITEEGRTSGNAIGGEYPQHYVKLTNDFYMAVYPGTIRQSALLFGNRWGSNDKANWFPSDACHHLALRGYRTAQGQPWTYVSGADVPVANSALYNLRAATGLRFDLPTEAQWEFACRAGTGTARPDMSASVADLVWYVGNSDGATHEVGLKQPNPWGLYDMLGNVAEWCRDYEGSYETAINIAEPVVAPTGPATATDSNCYRVKRGGSFRSPENWMRSAQRGFQHQTYTSSTSIADGGSGSAVSASGYRLVVDLD